MDSPIYILIAAEDPSAIRDLAARLKSWGYTPVLIKNPDLMERSVGSGVRMVLISSQFHERTGVEWTRKIRAFSSVPVFILDSPVKPGTLMEAVESGADDLIPAPLDPDLLQARMLAMLRRTYEYANEKEIPIGNGLSYCIDTAVLRYNGQIIDLTRTEQKILDVLAQKKGTSVSRGELMEALWQTSEFICDGTLSTSISRLRTKLKQVSGQRVIQTRKGVGYIIP